MRRILFVILSVGLQLNAVPSDAIYDRRKEEEIGKGVHDNAYVLYDSSFAKLYEEKKQPMSRNDENQEKKIRNDFTMLFKKVEQHFNNRSVMIRIKVLNISNNDDLGVPYKDGTKTLHGNKTLERLKEYAKKINHTTDSVFYLFKLATFKTFCTDQVSAALVSRKYKWWSIWSTTHATAITFGAERYTWFTLEDRKTMKEVFS
ncbi:hypothetical protein V5799_026947 [Amblyomma americanum]|uniref:Secreted protein n=1 Tax=Amblyomma americanum TaxID=6943 RepID=A0AAQ4DH48_AMBAM